MGRAQAGMTYDLPEEPEVHEPVAAHVAAYNARDVDRFVACFALDCVIEDARGAG